MKSWFYYICTLCLTCFSCTKTQHTPQEQLALHEAVYLLKQYHITGIDSLIHTLPDAFLKQAILFEYKYLQEGVVSDSLISLLSQTSKSQQEKIVYNYLFGDFLLRKYDQKGLLAFARYQKAYRDARALGDSTLTFEALKRMTALYRKLNKDIPSFARYQAELAQYARDSSDVFWAELFKLNLSVLKNYTYQKTVDSISDQDFKHVLRLAPKEPYHRGVLYQLQGIYQNLLQQQGDSASYFNEKAKHSYEQSGIFPSKMALYGLNVNRAAADINKKAYRKAIQDLKWNLRQLPGNEPHFRKKQFTAHWLSVAYKHLGKLDSAHYYLEQEGMYKDSVGAYQKLAQMYDTDARLNLEEKEKQITRLQKISEAFKRHKFVYGAIILGVLLVALYSVVRWLRLDRVNQRLVVEKEQTKKEINSIKELVVKDHILLKNKTKVLLEELVFVKSDDHYLSLFTTGKREFVRGKIREILKELPPNFIQCHRSYIVNTNYIQSISARHIHLKNNTYIPVSRTYRKRVNYNPYV